MRPSENNSGLPSLEVFYNIGCFCIRSFTADNTPYFEMESNYDQSPEVIQCLNEQKLNSTLLNLLDGLSITDQVPCHIFDCRKQPLQEKTIILRNDSSTSQYSSDPKHLI